MHSWLLPREYVSSVHEIDPRRMLELGINAVLVDLDNTLVEWTRSDLEPEVEDWVREALWAGLLDGSIDIAVHSAKDLSSTIADELELKRNRWQIAGNALAVEDVKAALQSSTAV